MSTPLLPDALGNLIQRLLAQTQEADLVLHSARSACPQYRPFLAKRNTEHGGRLGRWRWVVERTFA
jgi:hypothetical protein